MVNHWIHYILLQ